MPATGQLIRTLRVLLVISCLGPAILFTLAVVNDKRQLHEEARSLILKNVDILHEHALKVFETQELVIDQINAMLRGYDWQTIAATEEIHDFLGHLDRRLDQIGAIWLVGPESRYWASSAEFPTLARDIGDGALSETSSREDGRTRFAAPDEILDLGEEGYKIVSRRDNPSGQFDGLIIISVNLDYFRDFYARLTQNPTDGVALVRRDGTFLFRSLSWSRRPPSSPSREAAQAIAASNRGLFESVSEVDGVSRIVGYRKIAGYDAYVLYALDHASVDRAWLWRALIYGALATIVGFALFMFTRMALRHAEQTQALQTRLTGLNATLEDRVMDRTAELEGANDRLRSMVAEKELLLREVHHRVKNNLQVVSSLLNLQANASGKAPEFRDSLRRIRAMADLHEIIYQSPDLSTVPFSEYLTKLTREIVAFWIAGDRVEYRIHSDPLVLDLDTATPLGLLANEVLSNACKHAFPENRRGTITVRLRSHGDRATFSVRDDGVGLPSDFALRREEYLGLRIVDNLARQLDGRAEYTVDSGTCFTLDFAVPTRQSEATVQWWKSR